ncbi:MAG TPA: fluoride efflux transporter CrcB [Pyrinomonadaceae bacterium]|nr:fluoride efflux transporter CrcB [Pyrinomonadaceae bacterium]
MLKIVLIGVAGMAGTLGRYWVSAAAARRYGGKFPLDTFAVNVLGCFAIGFLAHVMRERLAAGETAGAVVMVGLLGGFTTFSSYGLQAFTLAREGWVTHAAAYVVASNLLGLLMVWAGHALARALVPA